MAYVHGEIFLRLEKDSFKIQDSKEHEEMAELVMSLEDAHKLFIELSKYFGSRQQKLEDLKGIWQEPSNPWSGVQQPPPAPQAPYPEYWGTGGTRM